MTSPLRCVVALLFALSLAQSRAGIAGHVVADDGRPIRHATVTLTPAGRSTPVMATTETDDDGWFMFDSVEAGRYSVRAAKPAFLDTEFGAKQAGHAGTAITVGAATRYDDLRMTMWRGAVVTGSVRTLDGTPISGAPVNVLEYAIRDGERALISPNPLARQFTDALGVYRIYGLPPGDAVVVASFPMNMAAGALGTFGFTAQSAADIDHARAAARGLSPANGSPRLTGSSPPSRHASFTPTFFPGAADSAGASIIHLSVGEERAGIDITMSPTPVASIVGHVQFADGTPAAGVAIGASTTDAATPEVAIGTGRAPASARSAADGSFTLRDLVPGRYHVQVRYTDLRAADRPPLFADAKIQMSGDDQQLTLVLQPGAAVRGTLTLVGAHPPPVPYFTVLLSPRDVSLTFNLAAGMFSDGRFAITAVQPGRYRLGLTTPAGWYLLSAAAHGVDLLDTPIDLSINSTFGDVVVTATDHPSELTGSLVDANGQPAAEYSVLVFPEDVSLRVPGSRRIAIVRPASDGTFALKNLPSGRYRLAALTDVDENDAASTSFLASLDPASIPITIADGQSTRQDLRIK